ncbi:uncharacterized protein [Acropora muricata]|uniref:uncharacterized protein n=1 Tax=Acropora muricata TaxID=159855 RepID=UPI0034E50A40
MDLKIRVFLLLLVLGIVVRNGEGFKACDWPRGVCTYIYDPCPPTFERCRRYDYSCPVSTNHCCCRTTIPGTTKLPPPPPTRAPPSPKPSDVCWGNNRGTCTYKYMDCPPNWHRCSQYDSSCKAPTNHCCCKNRVPARDITNGYKACDWPRGVCTYIDDPCPPTFERCRRYDYSCPVSTNHCCCRKTIPGTTTLPPPTPPPTRAPPTPKPSDVCWGNNRGTCTYKYMDCPPNWHRCPQYDSSCKVPTNHCCCKNRVPARDIVDGRGQAQVKCDLAIRGTCWFRGDATECPHGFKRCPSFDGGCANAENLCCCLA